MRFNRSIFLSFLWSYLLLMGIVISIVSAVFISRFSAQKEELRNSYQNTLNVMTESISVQLDRCMVLLDEYVLDVHASALVNAAQATDVHTRENILALHRTLANNVSWQDICRQVTYLFGKMGLALSNTGSCEMENCYKLYFCMRSAPWRNGSAGLRRCKPACSTLERTARFIWALRCRCWAEKTASARWCSS